MARKNQSLREIFKVTEWKDGCIYRTKHVGFAWVTFEHNPPQDGNLIFANVSTDMMRALGYRTLRSVTEDTPDMDITTLEILKKG